MTTHYVARHSSGMVHLRKSTGSLVYTHAVVGPRANQVQCAGRHDLAVKALAETRKWHDDHELVKLEEIDAATYAKLLKAGKCKAKTTFMGKVFTKTWPAGGPAPVAAVGYHLIAHTSRHAIEPGSLDERIADLEAMVSRGQGGEKSLEQCRANRERGYWVNEHRGEIYVHWVWREQDAESYVVATRNLAAFRCVERLDITLC